MAHVGLARLNCLDRSQPFGDQETLSGLPKTMERIRTRLGEDDRIARFDSPRTSAFGAVFDSLVVPGALARDLSDGPLVCDNVSKDEDGVISFFLQDAQFAYSRLGLQREDAQSADGSSD